MPRLDRSAPLLLAILATAAISIRADDPPRPLTVFLVGDSTVRNGSGQGGGGLWGWGNFLGDHLDPSKARVANRALGGRSSRTFQTEGHWAKVVADLKAGDVVLIQFGHNDGGPIDTGRARASLKGVGEESRDVVVEATGKAETVHTYGWYLRRYVAEAKAKGAIPVIVSPVPRNLWDADGGKVNRASKDYGRWAAEVAKSEGVPFLDLNALAADRYEAIGRDKVGRDFFTAADHTHTTEAGARVNARAVADGLRALAIGPLDGVWRPADAGPN